VIDTQKCKSKLSIIEQEFKHAEKAELWRVKAEDEMRQRVQRKRYEALEKARKEERLAKMKEDRYSCKGGTVEWRESPYADTNLLYISLHRRIREEIVHASKGLMSSLGSPGGGKFQKKLKKVNFPPCVSFGHSTAHAIHNR
jgi:hypothetical protein